MDKQCEQAGLPPALKNHLAPVRLRWVVKHVFKPLFLIDSSFKETNDRDEVGSLLEHTLDSWVSFNSGETLNDFLKTSEAIEINKITEHCELFQRAVNSTAGSQNVLSYGFYVDAHGEILSDNVTLSTDIFLSYGWELLSRTTSPATMYFLLTRCSIFQELPNNNYLQLCGPKFIVKSEHQRRQITNFSITSAAKDMVIYKKLVLHCRCVFYPGFETNRRVHFRLRKTHHLIFSPSSSDINLCNSNLSIANCDDLAQQKRRVELVMQVMFPWLLKNPDAEFAKPFTFPFRNLAIDVSHPEKECDFESLPKSTIRLLQRVYPMAKRISENAQNCNYHALLDKYCLSSHDGMMERGETLNNCDFVLSYHQVSVFCQKAIREIIPFVGFGCHDNWQSINRKIHKFVMLRRYEGVSVHWLAEGIKIKSIPWLSPISNCPHGAIKAKEILLEFILWLFYKLLIPLIRSLFYVTETSGESINKIVFYRHDDWHRLTTRAFSRMSEQFKVVDVPDGAEVATQRFIPKPNGKLRNIVRQNISASGRDSEIKGHLTKTLAVLSWLKDTYMPYNDGSIAKTSDLIPLLKNFKENHKETHFFVKLDIKSCFDNIPSARVSEICAELLNQSEYDTYHLKKLKIGSFTGQSTLYRDKLVFDKPGSLPQALASSIRNKILIDDGSSVVLKRKNIERMLNKHLNRNFVNFENKFYVMQKGIPQGSVLSTLFCGLVYDKFICHELELSPESMLFRYVDDFLFLTPTLKSATSFLEFMSKGFTEYGLHLNMSKSLVNFDSHLPCKRLKEGEPLVYIGHYLDGNSLQPIAKPTPMQSRVANNASIHTGLRYRNAKILASVIRKLKTELQAHMLQLQCSSLALNNAKGIVEIVTSNLLFQMRHYTIGFGPLKSMIRVIYSTFINRALVLNSNLQAEELRKSFLEGFLNQVSRRRPKLMKDIRKCLVTLKQIKN